tara:strand:+ start:1229 stop:2470 length:1242 start_codon:yes stop_codon:yes gene_type:complete
MKYNDLLNVCAKVFGTDRPADIARELDITPQAINNWKVRDQVPYKYTKKLKAIINEKNKPLEANYLYGTGSHKTSFNYGSDSSEDLLEIIFSIYRLILDNKYILILLPLLATMIICTYFKFFTVPIFSSGTFVLPVGPGQSSNQIANIASRYGVSINNEGKSNLASSEMVPAILKSRFLRTELLKTNFFVPDKKDSTILLSIVLNKDVDLNSFDDIRAKEMILKAGLAHLSKSISVVQSRGSRLIYISASNPDPRLAMDMASTIIKVLENVMNDFKQERVLEKKKFIQDRMMQTKKDLVLIEEKLKNFREQNRRILDSPSLMLQQERFIRDLQVQNQLYITLKTEYELARIEEIEGGSYIQILDPPSFPIRSINTSLKLIAFISFAGMFTFILITLFGIDFYKKTIKPKGVLI